MGLVLKGLEVLQGLFRQARAAAVAVPKFSRYTSVFMRSAGVLNGDWVPVLSSWIDAARWDDAGATLWVRVNYQGREYPWAQGITRERARSFFRVYSKGKWIWRWFPPRHLRAHLRRRGRGSNAHWVKR